MGIDNLHATETRKTENIIIMFEKRCQHWDNGHSYGYPYIQCS